jgi:multidrug efflux pump subunit AcrA (membrane-fusion protein)
MIFVTLLLVWIAINVTPRAPASENMNISDSSRTLSLSTQTVGSETEAFATFASWPGEIISPNDAEVQPPREGMIISWDVTIGEYIKAGQILGRLSAAPLTPELAKTLADQTESLTRARAGANRRTFFDTQSEITSIGLSSFPKKIANILYGILFPLIHKIGNNVLRPSFICDILP